MTRPTYTATRHASRIDDIKTKHQNGELSYSDAHKQLLHHGLSIGDVRHHLGEAETSSSTEMDTAQSSKKSSADTVKDVIKGNTTMTGKPANTVDPEPKLKGVIQGSVRSAATT